MVIFEGKGTTCFAGVWTFSSTGSRTGMIVGITWVAGRALQ